MGHNQLSIRRPPCGFACRGSNRSRRRRRASTDLDRSVGRGKGLNSGYNGDAARCSLCRADECQVGRLAECCNLARAEVYFFRGSRVAPGIVEARLSAPALFALSHSACFLAATLYRLPAEWQVLAAASLYRLLVQSTQSVMLRASASQSINVVFVVVVVVVVKSVATLCLMFQSRRAWPIPVPAWCCSLPWLGWPWLVGSLSRGQRVAEWWWCVGVRSGACEVLRRLAMSQKVRG